MIKIDPTQEIIIDVFNPGNPVDIIVSGQWLIGEEINYFRFQQAVPTYAGARTQIVMPAYWDTLLSLCCWRGLLPAGQSCLFVHAYIRQGGAVNNNNIQTLCSGWVSDANSIGYPEINRDDQIDVLAGNLQRTCVVAPAPILALTPVLGMPFKVVSFRGTLTLSAALGNRNVGLGVDDGAGNYFILNVNPTNFLPGAIITVTGSDPGLPPATFGTFITIPLPSVIVFNPGRFLGFINNVQIGDIWSNSFCLVRPYVDV